MKKEILVLTIFTVIVFLVSLTYAQEEPLEIVFWHHEAPAHRVAAFQKVMDLFMEENPNIKLRQEVVMWGDAWVKSLAAVEADTLPDFQFSLPDFTTTMFKTGSLVPLTDLVEEIDEKYQIFPNQKNMYFYNDEYWGLPIMTMVMLFTYRPSFLEEYVGTTEPPQTWDEVIDYAKKITEGSGEEVYGMGIGGARNLMVDEQAYVIMASVGAHFFDENGNIIFDSPETVEALKLYNELFKFAPPGAEAWSWGEIELNIAAGIIAMSPYFPSVQKRFHEEFDSDDYDAAHVPLYKDRTQRGTLTYPNDVHLYKSTLDRPGHKEAVYDFFRFMMKPEINAILTSGQEPGAFFPTSVAASQSEEYWDDPIVKRFENLHKIAMEAMNDYATLFGFEYGKWVNLGIGDITGANVLSDTINKVVSGQMTPEEAAAYGAEQMAKYSSPVGQ